MDAVEALLLFDHYGDLLTERQRLCLDLKYNQYMSLAEIAEELGVSRQGVHENLSRAEALLKNMEAKTGCVSRDQACRRAVGTIAEAAQLLQNNEDPVVLALAEKILSAAKSIEESVGNCFSFCRITTIR